MEAWMGFALWTAVVAWVVFGDGAEVLEGWRAALLSGSLFDAFMPASVLRGVFAVGWIVQLVYLLTNR